MEDEKKLESNHNKTKSNSKKAIGVVCGIFLGLIGLLIGICMFKDGSEERKTFVSGWVTGFVASFVVAIVLVIIYFAIIMGTIGSMM